MPNECVATLAELGADCIAGNHDLIALGRLSDDRCSRLARDSLAWTREELSTDTLRFLEALPHVRSVDGGIVFAHGSLSDPREYVRDHQGREAQIEELAGTDPTARLLVLGHTHQPVAHAERIGALEAAGDGAVTLAPQSRHVLNPGSVGQSRERLLRARCIILDLDRHEARLLAVRYDARACRRALRRRGLPPGSCHSKPQPIRNRLRALTVRLGG